MAAINEKIYIGSVDTPTLSFNQNSIEDIVCNNAVNLIGDELSSDTLEVSIFFDDVDSVLRNTAYGTTIFYYSNDYLVGKYYVSEIERRGVKRYLIRATSLIGLISKEEFYGGFYSGENFSDIVNDVLLTNGLVLNKYYLYEPISVRYGSSGDTYPHAVQVLFNQATIHFLKYRIHLDFEIINCYYTQASSNIAGNNRYIISIKPINENVFSIRLFYVDLSEPVLELSSSKIGLGSRIVVDINPLVGTAYMSANYVNPSDPTDTGFIEASTQISVPSQSYGSYSMNRAYGYSGGSTSSYYYQLIWHSFKVWDENGNLIINPVFAESVDGTKKYVINKYNGYAAETNYYNPYGEQDGMFGSFDRIDRDTELTKSLAYANSTDNIRVYGWIKNGTRRDALHQLLFSQNVCMVKSETGGVLFTTLSKNSVGNIEDDNLYDNSAEKSMSIAKNINITENTFESGESTQTIFDNSNSPLIDGQYIALFDKAPIGDTPVGNGITILYSNCNAAIVTGRGTIAGTPYVHSKNVISYTNGNTDDGSDVSVNNIGLITGRNSDSVMNKLKAYYSGALKKITNSIKYNGERCGLKYLFNTLYSDDNNAYLTKINARTSSFVKANCEFVYGFVPPSGGGYIDYAIATYGETWNIPQSVAEKEYPTIRLNIIGKGHDGTAGTNGANGNLAGSGRGKQEGGTGGSGGVKGLAGDGGYIYTLTVDATNVAYLTVELSGFNTIVKSYNSSGTLLNTYSSSSGNPSDEGFLNIFNGMYYARKGQDGVDGASGGKGGTIWRINEVEIGIEDPTPGEDVDVYTGGTSRRSDVYKQDENSVEWYYYNSYGGGGGAAYGTNGGNSTRVSQTGAQVFTAGGNGANAIVHPNPYTEYGSGGFGGNGGGGGGGAGTMYKWPNLGVTFNPGTAISQQIGYGGLGSSGTPGIDGCVIIYY